MKYCRWFCLYPLQMDMECISLLRISPNTYQHHMYHNTIFAILFETFQVCRVRKMAIESPHISRVHISHMCRQINYYMYLQNMKSIGFLYRQEVRMYLPDNYGNNHQLM